MHWISSETGKKKYPTERHFIVLIVTTESFHVRRSF
jgi:hypothetical protein